MLPVTGLAEPTVQIGLKGSVKFMTWPELGGIVLRRLDYKR